MEESENKCTIASVPNQININSKFKWGDGDTKLLLDLYYSGLPNVGPLKKFRNKKALWQHASNEIKYQLNLKYSPLLCETRLKTILKRKNQIQKKS